MQRKNNNKILALAPMADFTDQPFCNICREVSGQDFVIFREMVSAEAIVRDSKKTLKMCEFREVERPIILQIFGSKPDVMAEAGKILLEKYQPDGLDINMGCPVPKIAKKARAGAFLMRDHDRAIEIVKALKTAKLGVPVSVKTRLGWGRDDEILEFAPQLEQAGVDMISIHGRTKIQGYSGQANWSRIAETVKLVDIPVIANGDITSQDDIEKCLQVTGVDGVMIGRGALGNPWVFSSETKGKPSLVEIKKVVLRHAQLHLDHYGEQYGLTTFRKHLVFYFKGFPGVKNLRQKLVKINTLKELEEILVELS